MLMEVKRNLKLMLVCFKYNILKVMDNKLSFVGQVIGMILNNAIMIVQWIVLFSLKDNIGGYDFKDVLLLWAFVSGTYGISRVFFYNSFSLSRLIVTGKLDAFLVQPKDALLYVTTSSVSISAIGDILYGYILLIVLQSSLITYLLFTILIITGGIITASFAIILHSFSFWFNNVEDLANMGNNAFTCAATYPMGIFNDKVKLLFTTLIPISFVIYFPHAVIKSFDLYLFIGVILFCIFISSVAYIIFNRGLKRYSSTNLMSARI